MGFKDFLGKMKEEVAKNAQVTKRYNSFEFMGNIDNGLKNGDFGHGTYLNVKKTEGLIYGALIEDYTFTAEDIVDFIPQKDCKAVINKGGNSYPAERFIITFKDGKKAQADILADEISVFKKRFKLEQENQ